MRAFTESCRISYAQIGRDAGLGEPSRYLIARFLRGIRLNDDTLQAIDKYLITKGY